MTNACARGARGALLMVGVSLLAAQSARAQERLVSKRAAAMSASYENISFGNGGLVQSGFAGADTVRVTGVQQLSMPVTLVTSLGSSWKLDITALYASGTVRYREGNSSTAQNATLSGVSDVRIRATGSIISDALFLTVGANIPTGRTTLNSAEFSALRILAAPALGIASAPVGAGASGTVGVVYARVLGAWSLAAGASYEHRGRFQPVAAFTAGAPSADFKPGAVVRTSLSADRVIGAHRLFLAFTTDQFASDRLTGPGAAGASTSGGDLATVRLGPVFSADAQVQFAVPRFREVLAFTSYRWRSPYQREGVSVPGSSAQYLELGARSTVGVTTRSSLLFAIDGRVHSGLGVDQGLPTSGVASAAATIALDVKRGRYAIQPYLRGQAGSLQQRRALLPGSTSFRGAGAGIAIVTSF
jgi:hypothetical protein